jgi:hypothetical protein
MKIILLLIVCVSCQIIVDPQGNTKMDPPFLMDNETSNDPFLKYLIDNPQDFDFPSKKAVKFISKFGISVYAARKIKKDEVNSKFNSL